MNAYGLDLSLLDYGMSGQILEYLDHESPSSPSYSASSASPNRRPPSHRHDGTSPLPLGMDWSPPPRKWDGRDTVWPHDHHTGWSYCVTIPSWTILPSSRGSGPVVVRRRGVGELRSPTMVRRSNAAKCEVEKSEVQQSGELKELRRRSKRLCVFAFEK